MVCVRGMLSSNALGVAVSLYGFGGNALVAEDDKSLDNIVQLANIACPRACREYLYSLGVDALSRDVMSRAYLLYKILNQKGYVAPAFA